MLPLRSSQRQQAYDARMQHLSTKFDMERTELELRRVTQEWEAVKASTQQEMDRAKPEQLAGAIPQHLPDAFKEQLQARNVQVCWLVWSPSLVRGLNECAGCHVFLCGQHYQTFLERHLDGTCGKSCAPPCVCVCVCVCVRARACVCVAHCAASLSAAVTSHSHATTHRLLQPGSPKS